MISRRAFAMIFSTALGVAGAPIADRIAAADAAHVKEVEAWRAKHEADYTKEYVSLAGLFFLKPSSNTAGSASSNDIVLPKSVPASIGRFMYQNNTVRFEPRPGALAKLKNQPVTSPVELRSDGGTAPPDELAIGDVTFWVHESGKRRAIRMRDPQGDV